MERCGKTSFFGSFWSGKGITQKLLTFPVGIYQNILMRPGFSPWFWRKRYFDTGWGGVLGFLVNRQCSETHTDLLSRMGFFHTVGAGSRKLTGFLRKPSILKSFLLFSLDLGCKLKVCTWMNYLGYSSVSTKLVTTHFGSLFNYWNYIGKSTRLISGMIFAK